MPRTADAIGRDIAAAQQSLDALKAELADCQPSVLEVKSAARQATLTFTKPGGSDGLDFESTRNHQRVLGTWNRADAYRIARWFAYHYPEVSS